jgi:hypothetical protein
VVDEAHDAWQSGDPSVGGTGVADEHWDMSQQRFNSYYVCCGIKRGAWISCAADVAMSDAQQNRQLGSQCGGNFH